ncbi:MAG: sugar phosphate isomerase/epimerase family protein [Planctomycetaceae bacterium]
MSPSFDRREFLQRGLALSAGAALLETRVPSLAADDSSAPGQRAATPPAARPGEPEGLEFGLVTYQWGQGFDLPTLLAVCAEGGALGVELRTGHPHAVEPSLSKAERTDVKKRFADSPVTFTGPGSDERFDNPDPAVVKRAIANTKAFLQLSHDCGATGVKVKPDRFHPNVPREKTIEQIGKSLNECAKFAADLGQEVRLETHGQCSELPTIKAIMEVADHPAAAICWNCNAVDLEGEGLAHNFALVRDRFGATVHIHEFASRRHVYPYADLMRLLVESDYRGWLLLEGISPPEDKAAGLKQERQLFMQAIEAARAAKRG